MEMSQVGFSAHYSSQQVQSAALYPSKTFLCQHPAHMVTFDTEMQKKNDLFLFNAPAPQLSLDVFVLVSLFSKSTIRCAPLHKIVDRLLM